MSSPRFRENPGVQRYPKDEREWGHWINEVSRWFADQLDVIAAQVAAAAAQTSANNAAAYFKGNPATFVWNSDAVGVAPAGNPTRDLVLVCYDKTGASISTRTLRGTLTSAAATIAVTNVSTGGLANAYVLVDDGTASVRADITVTFADSSKATSTLAWSFVDEAAAGGTPTSGGGK